VYVEYRRVPEGLLHVTCRIHYQVFNDKKMEFFRKNTVSVKYNYAQANDSRGWRVRPLTGCAPGRTLRMGPKCGTLDGEIWKILIAASDSLSLWSLFCGILMHIVPYYSQNQSTVAR
jgi:hypothetical protein